MRTTLPPVDEAPLETSRFNSPRTGARNGGVVPSAEAHAALMAMYDAKLAQWPVPHEEFDVPTRYGRTHVVAAGSPETPPLLMLHMAASTSVIWAPVIAPLAARYRTYAVDMIGDVNKSVLDDPERYPKTGDALAGWLCEVSDALQIERSDVIGGSYGGWLGMHYATYAPARVRRLVLIVPMGLPTWTQTARVLLRLVTIQIGLSPSKMERTLSYLMGDDPVARRLGGDWFAEVFAWKCKMKVPSPLPVPVRRLEAIRMPTLIVLGGRDRLIGNAERAVRRAKAHIPNVEIELVPNGTHAVHAEEPQRVATRVLQFLEH